MKCCTDWIASLKGDDSEASGETRGEGGDEGTREEEDEETREEGGKKMGCNLLDALKLALQLPDLDTICVILSSK